jgi:hypothetical protein
VCCGEIESGTASVCTLQWKPHLMFCFSDHKSILSVLTSHHSIIILLSKCTSLKGNLKYRFHGHQIHTYLNFTMLVVCSSDVSRVCNIKNNFSKNNPSPHIRCMCFHVTCLALGGLHTICIFLEKISWLKSSWSHFTRGITEMP